MSERWLTYIQQFGFDSRVLHTCSLLPDAPGYALTNDDTTPSGVKESPIQLVNGNAIILVVDRLYAYDLIRHL